MKIKNMPHSFTKIIIHAVWSTKNREPLIRSEIESQIHTIIHDQFVSLRCPVIILNGMPNLIHVLFLQNPEKPLSDIIKQVKGGSSHTINSLNLLSVKFAWQSGYASYTAGISSQQKLFEYIQNQKQHHQKKTFTEEYHGLMKASCF